MKLRSNNVQEIIDSASTDEHPSITGTCSELPIGRDLKTSTVFPIKQGSEVIVKCAEGFTFTSGDKIITCVEDAEYTSPRQLPSCMIGRCSESHFDASITSYDQ